MGNTDVYLKILVDNVAAPGLLAEHGFSMLIEADGQKILFDTGHGKALPYNAKNMNVDLQDIDLLTLSHGHYDHTGGLPAVLNDSDHVVVYCHRAAFLPRYSINNGLAKPVKMGPEAMVAMDSLPEKRMHWVAKPVKITNNIGVTGEIPRDSNFEDTGGAFYFDQDGKRTDSIKDDMAIWISTSKGLVICVGCCHSGIINTLTYVQKLTSESKIHTLVGGLHLLNADQARLARTVEELRKFDIDHIVPCHCTGDTATALLMREMNCRQGYGGMELRL